MLSRLMLSWCLSRAVLLMSWCLSRDVSAPSRLCPGDVPVHPLLLSRLVSRGLLGSRLNALQRRLGVARHGATIGSATPRAAAGDRSLTTARVAGVTRDHTHTSEVETSTCLEALAVDDGIFAADEKWILLSGIQVFRYVIFRSFSDHFHIRFSLTKR